MFQPSISFTKGNIIRAKYSTNAGFDPNIEEMAETRIPLQACAFVGWLTLSSTEHDLLIYRYISPSNRKPTFAVICQFKLVLSLSKLQLVVIMVDMIIVTKKVLVNPNATELTLHPMLLYLCKRVLIFSDNRNERSFFPCFLLILQEYAGTNLNSMISQNN